MLLNAMSGPDPFPGCTVVIPTRDRCRFLGEALQCALGQWRVSVEVVVVDDASSDGTREYLSQVTDDRVRVIRNAEPAGVAVARNRGIGVARSPWIAFLDDDDLWAPTKLHKQLAATRRSGASWCYTDVAHVTDGSSYGRVFRRSVPLQGVLQSNPTPTPSSVMVSRAALLAVDGFDPRLTILADWDLWIRLAQISAPAVVGELLVGYRHHPAQLSLASPDVCQTVAWERAYMLSKHRTLLRGERFPLGGRDFLLWRAGILRAAGRRARAAATYLLIGLRYRSFRDLGRAVGQVLGETVSNRLHPRRARVEQELTWLPSAHPQTARPRSEAPEGSRSGLTNAPKSSTPRRRQGSQP
jgi:glycosyltransferase involved in cell wall biosynthesis